MKRSSSEVCEGDWRRIVIGVVQGECRSLVRSSRVGEWRLEEAEEREVKGV